MHFDTLVHLRDDSKYTGLDRLLLIEIELFAAKDTHRAMPSVKRLAHDLGVSERWVQVRLKRLVAEGALGIDHGTGRSHTNIYTLLDTEERVNSASGFPAERVNSWRRKGEEFDSERVNSTSPEVVQEKERKERPVALFRRREEAKCGHHGCHGPQCPHTQFCRPHANCRDCAVEAVQASRMAVVN
jgi:DNA-binding transcriptional regulator YhcF (GntR family)